MKGDIADKGLYDQSYRQHLSDLINKRYPDAQIIGHDELYPNGIDTLENEKIAFFELINQAAMSDVLISFLPKASMGTAIEIWEAYKKGKIILSVTPFKKNWTVNFLSSCVFTNLLELENFLELGSLNELLTNRNIDIEHEKD